jgi:hypothetical protein
MWTDTFKADLAREIREDFAEVMLNSTQSYPAMYNADWTFVNQSLSQHYDDVADVTGTNFRSVTTSERGGVLVNGAFMSRWGEAKETSPIRRAVRVRKRMLCQNMPFPPAGVSLAREDLMAQYAEELNAPTTTNRRKYEILTQGYPCERCHTEWINPLGFGMEDYDTVGKKRSLDRNGNPINAEGTLYAPDLLANKATSTAFTGAEALGELLATSATGQTCMVENFFQYLTGVGTSALDANTPNGPKLDPAEKNGYRCEAQTMLTNMNTSPRVMLERMGGLEAVRFRKAWPRLAQ